VRAACVRAAACHYLSGHLPLTCCQCPLPANAAVEWSGAVHLGGQVPERRDGDRVVPCPGHGRKDLGAEWPVVLLVLEWVSSPPPPQTLNHLPALALALLSPPPPDRPAAWVIDVMRASVSCRCAIGCKTCDGSSRGPIPWGSFKNDPKWGRKFNLCPVGAANSTQKAGIPTATLCDPAKRTVNTVCDLLGVIFIYKR
jgi:hypothetical protein